VRAIGVISDTHGLLREEALQALAGSDLIIHAGDVGKLEILERLSEIAPVRAVYGNTDWGELKGALPGTEVVDLDVDGPLAYVLHIFETLNLDPVAAGFRVVIFGHTHEPLIREHEGVLYLNPGSAGDKRPDLPVTVARLTLEGEDLRAEIVDLTTGKVAQP
jgi:putative phosphoesterase